MVHVQNFDCVPFCCCHFILLLNFFYHDENIFNVRNETTNYNQQHCELNAHTHCSFVKLTCSACHLSVFTTCEANSIGLKLQRTATLPVT